MGSSKKSTKYWSDYFERLHDEYNLEIEETPLDVDDIYNVQVGGFDLSDYPDFTDTFIESGYIYSRPLTNDELETINEDSDYISRVAHEYHINIISNFNDGEVN